MGSSLRAFRLTVRCYPDSDMADPDPMFEVGLLVDVYSENPVQSCHALSARAKWAPHTSAHCKAMEINFGFARDHGAHCYQEHDGTHPEE